jgi:hypothetical protein
MRSGRIDFDLDFDLVTNMLTCHYTPASTRSMASPQAEAPNDGEPLILSAGRKRADENTSCAESPDMLPV